MATRDEFDLTALADVLVVDVENGPPNADTKIEYRKNKEWVPFHRVGGGDWVKVPLTITDLDDPTLIQGDFPTLPLRLTSTAPIRTVPCSAAARPSATSTRRCGDNPSISTANSSPPRRPTVS